MFSNYWGRVAPFKLISRPLRNLIRPKLKSTPTSDNTELKTDLDTVVFNEFSKLGLLTNIVSGLSSQGLVTIIDEEIFAHKLTTQISMTESSIFKEI